mmetsp:Transcript_12895/g.20006  ORF Transcript_12895/g.20006 Transcript_12895/m.20006 type:complete len:259 (+) Transcript_12895:77-853(+)
MIGLILPLLCSLAAILSYWSSWPTPQLISVRADDPNTPHLRPILFLHGISGHAHEFNGIMALLQQKYGSKTPTMHSIGICEGSCSLMTPLPQQRDNMLTFLVKNAAALGIDSEDGFNIVAHSQGALLMRAVIQKLPASLKVHTYVSMAGPQRGQWGPCNKSNSGIGPKLAKKMARPVGWIAFYNPLAQRELSFANYWNDPRHNELFRKEANFLPEINGYVVNNHHDNDDDISSSSSSSSSMDGNVLHCGFLFVLLFQF